MKMKKNRISIPLCLCIFALLSVGLLSNRVNAEGDDAFLDAQNGIPLIIIRIDESDKAVADANENDDEHTYGKISDMNDSEDHSVRCVGTVEFIVPDEYKGEYGSVSVPDGEVKLEYIRGRGNSTWEIAVKRPYKIKLDEASDLFGMGSSKEWALLANDRDGSLIKNRIVMWLGDQMGLDYTPQMIPVDVVMIGSESGSKYLGSYCLSELVDVEEARVDIAKMKKNDTAESGDISGGYLISIHSNYQNQDTPDSSWFTTSAGKVMINHEYPYFESEDLEEGRKQQRAYIQEYVNRIDELIMADVETFDQERHDQIAQLLDLTSAADYWWIQEFSHNGDAFDTDSTFFYKERDGKLYFGPLWDFDLGFIGSSEETLKDTLTFNYTRMPWIDALREKDPYFIELLKERFVILNEKLEMLVKDDGIIDQYEDELMSSKLADLKARDDGYYESDSAAADDYSSRMESLKNNINIRRKWMSENIDKVNVLRYVITYEVDGQVYKRETIRGEDELGRGERPPGKDGMVFVRWVEKESGIESFGYKVMDDTTFVAEYKKLEDMTEPEQLFFDRYEDYVKISELTYMIYSVKVFPEEAGEDAISTAVWSSSDESIATVNDTGEVVLLGTGDVEITLTLYNGLSRSLLLHIYDPDQMQIYLPNAMKHQPESVTLKPGEFCQIENLFECDDQPCLILFPHYISQDPEIADVDYMGILTAYKPGKVIIESEAFFVSEGKDRDPLFSQIEVIVTEESTKGSDNKAGLAAVACLAAGLIYYFIHKNRKTAEE